MESKQNAATAAIVEPVAENSNEKNEREWSQSPPLLLDFKVTPKLFKSAKGRKNSLALTRSSKQAQQEQQQQKIAATRSDAIKRERSCQK
jgi:hypothetical protein